jgi:UDP-N-acetyl-D-mannosaminuronic acid dehydrogenase
VLGVSAVQIVGTKVLFTKKHINKLVVRAEDTLFHAMELIDNAPSYDLPPGMALVTNETGALVGVITDGDVRDALLHGLTMDSLVGDVMTKDPVTIPALTPPENIIDVIQHRTEVTGSSRSIRYAVMVDSNRRPAALVDIDRLVHRDSLRRNDVAVIGLGYVGLTLAVTLAEAGFQVTGIEKREEIRSNLRKGISHVFETGLESMLQIQLEKKTFQVADSFTDLKDCGVFIVAVNTPVVNGVPDVSYVEAAIEEICPLLTAGTLVILRSTVPVGTCRSVVKRIIEANTPYAVGQDIGLAFAPERTIQGSALVELRTLPQIVGGINELSVEQTTRLFSRMGASIVSMTSLEEAEIVKLINNSFRDVSFAFANEVALLCERFNIDAARVIQSANNGYGRNLIALPSPGVGGLCLSKDPYMLSNAYPQFEGSTQTLPERARWINEFMPKHIAERILNELGKGGKSMSHLKLFVMGLAFKGEPETNDLRNSPALDLARALMKHGLTVYGYDAVVPRDAIEQEGVKWAEIEAGIEGADAVMVMNNHRSFSRLNIYQLTKTMNTPAILFDGWNMFKREEVERPPHLRYMTMGYLTPLEV